MSRRHYKQAKDGQLYASEWPEWHVDCAVEGCGNHALAAGIGEAYTLKEAEKVAQEGNELKEWKKIKGLWYCPRHKGDVK